MIDFPEFSDAFRAILAQNELSHFCGEPYCTKLYTLTEHMLAVNEHMNLTAIKEPRAIILRHYADSLTIAPFLTQGARVVDIGCGAGFPSLPLAICRPDLEILSLDSTAKRIRYVEQTAQLLGCDRLAAVAMRAEDGGRGEYREQFDVCTARAVAALPVLAELCLPFVRPGGKFLAMKAKKGQEEWESAARAISRLGGKLIAAHSIRLRNDDAEEERVILEIEKIKHTPPEFPRAFAKISKNPL